MNTYLTNSKVEFIKSARADLLELYNIDYTPFTRKIYFYFFKLNGKKYVHKDSLRFVYSNADTYTVDINPNHCALNKQIDPVDIVMFLETYTGPLLPNLIESNSKFLVYEYIDGQPLEEITKDEFYQLKQYTSQMSLTPFYNSMTYNLTRSGNDVKLVDLKHFETKTDLPFFVYFYNEDNRVNNLYTEAESNLDRILQHLNLDYPADSANIKIY
jgi:hypothetical protein